MRVNSFVKPRGYELQTGPLGQATCWYNLQAPSSTASCIVPTAFMAMPRFKVRVNDKVLAAVTRSSDALWPGQGRRGVSRFTRDAITRYLRYSDGNTRRRAK